ncbi:MAG: SulP family inorganic anion transporter [Candidatus Methylacidiphilales bacterium]
MNPVPEPRIDKGVTVLRALWSGFFKLAMKSQLHPFPIWPVWMGYRKAFVQSDLRAALNVALLAFPQGMAYAVIAGLPIEYGIYGTIIASVVGPLFSGSRHIILGPTNATAVLLPVAMGVLALTQDEKLVYVPLLMILVGVFLMVGAFFQVANLTQYISRSVVTGYITAAAVYIVVNQVKNMAGLSISSAVDSTLLQVIWNLFSGLRDVHLPSLFLSLMTAGFFLVLQRRAKALPNVALTLFIMTFLGILVNWLINQHHELEGEVGGMVRTLGAVHMGHWNVMMPSVNYRVVTDLMGSAMVIAFLCILEGTSIGKSLAARSGDRLNSNQEMFAMGVANVACGLGGGMAASGSLTRSTLNEDSGAKTAMAGVFCGLICLAGLWILGPWIRFIPVPALGTLVVFIGFSLINRRVIRLVTRSTGSDAAVFFTTFLAAILVRLDFAIITGAVVSIILFLRKVSTPELVEYSFNEQGHLYEIGDKATRPNPQISIVHVEGELFFGAADLFRDQMRRVCDDPSLKVVILRLKNAYHLDATSVMALEELISHLKSLDRHLIVSGARKDVYRVFKRSGLLDVLGKDNFFMGSPANPNVSTRNALKRAQSLLGGQKADVRIYYDPNK